MSCTICFLKFLSDDNSRQPLILVCGHSYCKNCMDEIIIRKRICPTCKTSINFQKSEDIPRNFALIELLKDKTAIKSDSSSQEINVPLDSNQPVLNIVSVKLNVLLYNIKKKSSFNSGKLLSSEQKIESTKEELDKLNREVIHQLKIKEDCSLAINSLEKSAHELENGSLVLDKLLDINTDMEFIRKSLPSLELPIDHVSIMIVYYSVCIFITFSEQ